MEVDERTGYRPDPEDDGPHQNVTPFGVPFYVAATLSHWAAATHLLIDTGAMVSLLPEVVYKQLPKEDKGRLVATPRSVCCGNLSAIRVKGIAFMKIRIENIEYQATFHITPDVPRGILGQDFLRRYDATIESKRNRLSISGRTVKLYDDNGLPLHHRVTANSTVFVPPGTRYVVPGRIQGKGEVGPMPFLVEGARSLYDKSGVLVAKMISTHYNSQLGIEVHNTTDETQRINKNTTLGVLAKVQRVYPWSSATVEDFHLTPEQRECLREWAILEESSASESEYEDVPELREAEFDEEDEGEDEGEEFADNTGTDDDDVPDLVDVYTEEEEAPTTDTDGEYRDDDLILHQVRGAPDCRRTFWDDYDPDRESVFNDDPQAHFDDWVEEHSSEYESDGLSYQSEDEAPLMCNSVSQPYYWKDEQSLPGSPRYQSASSDETDDAEVSRVYCGCDECSWSEESYSRSEYSDDYDDSVVSGQSRYTHNPRQRPFMVAMVGLADKGYTTSSEDEREDNTPLSINALFTERPEYIEPEGNHWTCSNACYPYGDIPEYHVEGLPPHMQSAYTKYAASLELPWDKFAFYLLLQNYADIFAKDRYDLGKTNLAYHHIDTGSARPFKQKTRRLPQAQHKEMETQVQKLADIGIIRPSKSNYASNVLLVQKKDNTWRLCIDYRRLNAQTVNTDPYLIPRIDDTLEHLQGAKYFCTLDLAQGYHQVEMDEESKTKTAFTTPHMTPSLWEFNCMPFGITGGPGTFQRVMDRLLVGMQFKIALAYLDDIIVYGLSPQQVIDRLARVFDRIRSAGLKLKPSKCTFFEKETLYLGHVVSREGIKCDPAKIEKVKTWPRPKSGKACLQFVGFCNYYNRFLKDFSAIAKPLYALGPKKVPFKWGDEEETAFQTLKTMLTSPPVMAYPREVGPWILDTDASGFAMGAVLAQVQPNEEGEEEERVIAYGSKVFQGRQQRYCTRRRELLSVVHFVNAFRPYLYGRFVTIRTDHASLRYLKTLNNPDDQFARWIQILEETYYTIEVRKGTLHGNADAMSRLPGTGCEGKRCICVPVEHFEEEYGLEDDYRIQSAAFDENEENEQPKEGSDTEDEIHGHPQAPATKKARGEDGNNPDSPVMVQAFAFTKQWRSEEMASAQASDPDIELLYMAKKLGADKPDRAEINQQSSAARTYFHDWKRIKFESNRVLYRQWESSDGTEVRYQIILPETYQQALFTNLHDAIHAAHMGRRRTMSKLQQKFYWHRMGEDIQTWIRACPTCQRRKALYKNPKAPLHSHHVGMPNERVAMDIIDHLPRTLAGNVCVLTIVDHFSKYAKAVALPDQKAKTVADAFMKWWVCVFGTPYQVHSDQGRNFESGLMHELCKLLHINKTRTTPYNPAGNGQCERQNQTIMNLIHTYARESPVDWDKHLHTVMMGYNATKQESTNLEPNRLMLGRNVDMPADLMLEHDPTVMPKTVNEYVADMERKLRLAYQLARKNLTRAATAVKRHYDKNAHMYSYETGQMVKVRVSRKLKGQKFVDRYEGPYYVIDNPGSETTFRVIKTRHSKIRTLHHNKLLPYNPTPEERAADNTWVFELARQFWNLRANNQETQTELTISKDEDNEAALQKLAELVLDGTSGDRPRSRTRRERPFTRKRPGWWKRHQVKKTSRVPRETRRMVGNFDREKALAPLADHEGTSLHVKTFISTDLTDEQCEKFWEYMQLSRQWNADTGIGGLMRRVRDWGTHSNDPQPLRALAHEMEWYGLNELHVGDQTFCLTPRLEMWDKTGRRVNNSGVASRTRSKAGTVRFLRAREMGERHMQKMFVSTASQTHVFINPHITQDIFNSEWHKLLSPLLDLEESFKTLDEIREEGCYACKGMCVRFEEGEDPTVPCIPYDRRFMDWTPGIHEPSLENNIAASEIVGWIAPVVRPSSSDIVQTKITVPPNEGTAGMWRNINEQFSCKDFPPEFQVRWRDTRYLPDRSQVRPPKSRKNKKVEPKPTIEDHLRIKPSFADKNYRKSFLDDIQLCTEDLMQETNGTQTGRKDPILQDYEGPHTKYSLRSREVVQRDKVMSPSDPEKLIKPPVRRQRGRRKRELVVADSMVQTILRVDMISVSCQTEGGKQPLPKIIELSM